MVAAIKKPDRKYFGTDGIRGKVGEFPITPEFVMRLGWAAGRVLVKKGSGDILIGKDTRISGYMFESALEAGLSAAGMNICLLGPMPTPAIAYLTRSTRAKAGIVISASHNQYQDNGIKFFSSDGMKLADDIEYEIELEMEKPLEVVSTNKLGKAKRIHDAARRYIEFCKSRINLKVDLKGTRILVDCAQGAAYHIAPKVFEELGAEVNSIGTQPDGININENCGATRPELLQQKVIETSSHAGIALDGDGDRLIMVDEKGEIVDGDEILFIMTRECRDALKGAVVGTQMSNLGLEQAVNNLGLDFVRASVGDRYVMEMLQQKNLVLGGEPSGHIVNLNKTTTGDGIISALQVLEAMQTRQMTLSELKSGMHKYPQTLINVKLDKMIRLDDLQNVAVALRSAQADMGDKGRILLRESGTEPIIRVMVEGEDREYVAEMARNLAQEVETGIKAYN